MRSNSLYNTLYVNSQCVTYEIKMKNCFILVWFLILAVADISEGRGRNAVLSRRRRYITFPEGSSVSIAACMTAQTGVIPPGIFTESIAWGIAYELPDNSTDFKDLYAASKFLVKRRHRRDLYGKMETIMDSMGYNGRSCILRSLCEASYRFLPKEDNLLHYILKIIFGFPEEKVLPSEPDEHHIYHFAHQKGKETEDCSEAFPQCPFSLIDMALGHYSQFGD